MFFSILQDFEPSRSSHKVAVMLDTSVLLLNIIEELTNNNNKITENKTDNKLDPVKVSASYSVIVYMFTRHDCAYIYTNLVHVITLMTSRV